MNLPVVSRSKGRTLGYDLCFGVEYDMYLVVVLFQFEIVEQAVRSFDHRDIFYFILIVGGALQRIHNGGRYVAGIRDESPIELCLERNNSCLVKVVCILGNLLPVVATWSAWLLKAMSLEENPVDVTMLAWYRKPNLMILIKT